MADNDNQFVDKELEALISKIDESHERERKAMLTVLDSIYPRCSAFVQIGMPQYGISQKSPKKRITIWLDPKNPKDAKHFMAICQAYDGRYDPEVIPIAIVPLSDSGWNASQVSWIYKHSLIRQTSLANAVNWFHEYTVELQNNWVEDLEKTFSWFPDEVSCGRGWQHLIRQLCQDIQAVLDAREEFKKDFRLGRIKAKYAQLTVYASPEISEIERLLFDAADKSTFICEDCGAPGVSGSVPMKLSDSRRWDCVLCPRCQPKDFIAAKPED